jgi:dTDP-4-amino-4,6-dideoxygalactose transaminase
MAGAGRLTVPSIDLRAEHAPLEAELVEAFVRVCRSGQFVLGEEVSAFEREIGAFLGARHAVGVSSGTDALLCGLLALGVGAGDEVITTPFTFFATAEAIVRAGATPRFVDLRPDTLNLDEGAVEAAIGARTRAIVPVHLFGTLADMPRLGAIAARHGLPILADAAQALGAARDGRRAGAECELSAFSFHPTKPLGALGDGGLLTTDDGALAERCRELRAHGATEKHHHLRLGGNFRLDALQAALLRVKLAHLPARLDRRAANAAAYSAALSGIEGLVLPRVPAGITSPRPVYAQPALAGLRVPAGAFPECERAVREVLSIPVHAGVSNEQRAHVIEAITEFF